MYLSIYKQQEGITSVCFFSKFYYITYMKCIFLAKKKIVFKNTYINNLL